VRREDEIIVAWMNCQIAHGNGRKMVALKLRPALSSVDGNPKAKLSSEKQEIGFDQIFLDHVSVSTNAFRVLRCYERRPSFTVISRFENIRHHVAKSMPVKRGVSGAGVEVARLNPGHPRVLGQTGDVTDDIRPGLAAVARDLKIPVIRADPDHRFLFRRFAD